MISQVARLRCVTRCAKMASESEVWPLTYFSFHVPKTGGTSIKRVLESWFITRRDDDIAPQELRRLEREQPDDLCIHGHFSGTLLSRGDALLARYPWIMSNPKAFVLTLFRDPVEHALSYYYHERAAGRVQLPLVDFLKTPHAFALSKALEVSTRHEMDGALYSFAFIGVTEELQRSADLLADMVGKPKQEVPRDKLGERDGQVLALSAEERRAVEALYPIECELYARARDSLFGKKPISRAPDAQFTYLRDRYTVRTAVTSGANWGDRPTAQIISFSAHDTDGVERGRFDCREPVGLTVEFEVRDAAKIVEPAFRVTRQGHAIFVVAYVPDDGAPRQFAPGRHRATAWIPGNLLNPGPFEIVSNLATPWPVERFDQTAYPIVLEITEPEDGAESARGGWRTSFPGGVRPLLKWTSS